MAERDDAPRQIAAPTALDAPAGDVERRRAHWRTPEMRALMRRALDEAAERARRLDDYEVELITELKALAVMRLAREARDPAYRMPEMDEALRRLCEGDATMLERLAAPSDEGDGTE